MSTARAHPVPHPPHAHARSPFCSATVDSLVSMAYSVPSYRISLLEIRLIWRPRYGTDAVSDMASVCAGVGAAGGRRARAAASGRLRPEQSELRCGSRCSANRRTLHWPITFRLRACSQSAAIRCLPHARTSRQPEGAPKPWRSPSATWRCCCQTRWIPERSRMGAFAHRRGMRNAHAPPCSTALDPSTVAPLQPRIDPGKKVTRYFPGKVGLAYGALRHVRA